MEDNIHKELFVNNQIRIYRSGDQVFKTVDLRNSQQKMENIMRELDIISHLNHENVIKFKFGTINPLNAIICLEFANMGDLCNFIPEDYNIFILQMMNGVKYIHDNFVFHRDIKPQNILVQNGIPKIADFDLAVKLNSKHHKISGTAGTLRFMSPENLSNRPQGLKSDIWSLGMTIYYLISKKRRYLNNIDATTYKKFLKNPVIKVNNELIQKMLIVHPFFRYSIDEIFDNVVKDEIEIYGDKYQNLNIVEYSDQYIAISDFKLEKYSIAISSHSSYPFEVCESTMYDFIPDDFAKNKDDKYRICQRLLNSLGFFFISTNIV